MSWEIQSDIMSNELEHFLIDLEDSADINIVIGKITHGDTKVILELFNDLGQLDSVFETLDIDFSYLDSSNNSMTPEQMKVYEAVFERVYTSNPEKILSIFQKLKAPMWLSPFILDYVSVCLKIISRDKPQFAIEQFKSFQEWHNEGLMLMSAMYLPLDYVEDLLIEPDMLLPSIRDVLFTRIKEKNIVSHELRTSLLD